MWIDGLFVRGIRQTLLMQPKFNAYIDGFNLYKGVLSKRPHLKWLDLKSWCESLLPNYSLNTVYYFTARVKRKYEFDKAPERQHLYLRALQKSGVEIAYGRTRKSSKWQRLSSGSRNEIIQPELKSNLGLTQMTINSAFRKSLPDVPKAQVLYYEEKGTDVNIASYLLRDCYNTDSNASLVVSGDADLVTPIRFACESGQFIKIVVPNSGQKIAELGSVSSEISVINPDQLCDFQFPTIYEAPTGRLIHRPPDWS